MAALGKGSKIVRSIRAEVSRENLKLGMFTAKNSISGDLGCSDSSGCSTYCSES